MTFQGNQQSLKTVIKWVFQTRKGFCRARKDLSIYLYVKQVEKEMYVIQKVSKVIEHRPLLPNTVSSSVSSTIW